MCPVYIIAQLVASTSIQRTCSSSPGKYFLDGKWKDICPVDIIRMLKQAVNILGPTLGFSGA